ncbi:hypothetical protein D3D02_17255 [Halobellus sp. Atlit-38R]|uniref:formyltransferase family protein n=1 Tax=Halobellus sp. Atlit-38R TaxID=2282131 RepID=UPI000EF1D4DE|nr:formyltransferase family protein [Halobellus sp. Atlit-38R]RLM83633.1 hypothetical protein D3D02_17255 [Halobellus sp. Atlit-38R]
MASIALLGSRPLSRECLKILDNTDEVTVEAVVTYPQEHNGWWEGSLNKLATDLGYPVVEESDLFTYDLDYLISTLYFNVLSSDLLEHANKGGLNLHQAELPRYRGSNTFSHAIMNAREDDYWKYGTTFHFMTEEVDAGDIIARNFVDITEEDTAKSLYEKTEQASIELFEEMIPHIISGEVHEMRTPQKNFESKEYFYSKNSLDGEKEILLDELCDPDQKVQIYDKIRALDFPPFEPAYTYLNDQKVYLTKTSYEEIVE